MLLKKNLLGLFFFFLWGTLFSQWEQIEIANESFVEYAFLDHDEAQKINPYVYSSRTAMLSYDDTFATLLDSLTVVEEKSEKFSINFLNINSSYSDYAPSFFDGELVFASSRNVNSISKSFDGVSNQPFLDLYTATKMPDKERIRKLKGAINTKFHESSVAFSKDKKTVYFTRNNYSKNKRGIQVKGNVLLKIYKATNIDGKWKNVEELPFNSDDYSVAHPALSPDGKFLYFASDMPGSYGKSDLYFVAIHDDGSYSTPVNMGDRINTAERETFPYVSDKGNLFFTSNGHRGQGGLDVFMVLPDKNGNTGAYNLGAPINSPDDDFTLIINEKHKVGYFASNRDGGKGDDDIYGFRQLKPFPKLLQLQTIQKLERVIHLKLHQQITTLD